MTTPYGQSAGIRELPPDSMAPVVEWDDFINYIFDWQQDEHVGLIGPTGSGKSTVEFAILPMRKYVTFFATKPADRTLEAFAKKGKYTRIEEWPPKIKRGLRARPATAEEMPKRILWPDATILHSQEKQREVFQRAFSDIYAQGGWCVVWDEFWYMTHILDLENEARIFLQQARANRISFVMGSQRPSRIPLEVFDQSSHLFFWRDSDEINLKRMGGIGWLASGPIRAFVASLQPHQFLYVNTRKGWLYRSTAPEVKIK